MTDCIDRPFAPPPEPDGLEPVTVTIPGTPQGKGRPRFSRLTGTSYTPAKTRAYEKIVAQMAALEMRGREPFDRPVHLDLRAVFEIPKSWPESKRLAALSGAIRPTSKPDIDNVVKVVADGLTGIVITDDSLIVSERSSKVYGTTPFVVATVRVI